MPRTKKIDTETAVPAVGIQILQLNGTAFGHTLAKQRTVNRTVVGSQGWLHEHLSHYRIDKWGMYAVTAEVARPRARRRARKCKKRLF